MFGILPLSPAYGRHYSNRRDLEADLKSGKDFKAASGQYIALRELKSLGLHNIEVRYGKQLEKVTVVTI